MLTLASLTIWLCWEQAGSSGSDFAVMGETQFSGSSGSGFARSKLVLADLASLVAVHLGLLVWPNSALLGTVDVTSLGASS